MADNINISLGSGATVATDQVGGIHYQKIKLYDGTDDSENGLEINADGLLGSLVTINHPVSIAAGESYIGLVTVDMGSMVIDEGEAYIGLATVDIGSIPSVTLGASEAYVGLATVNVGNSVTVDLGANNDVTNAGTTKTIIPKTLAISPASITTIAVPTNTFYITNVMINSNSSVRVNIKSGATYLTGNASIGVTLNPGGGWVENGSPDSPLYDGLADAGAIVIEKWEDAGWVSELSGHITYYEE